MKKETGKPRWQAARPSARQACVFPVPELPRAITLSRAMRCPPCLALPGGRVNQPQVILLDRPPLDVRLWSWPVRLRPDGSARRAASPETPGAARRRQTAHRRRTRLPLSQTGAELLFEIFSQRHERGSTIVTSNLPFEEWTTVFGSQRLTGALLDRLTHHVHILELNGESYRLKQSKARRRRDPRPADEATAAADPETGEITIAS